MTEELKLCYHCQQMKPRSAFQVDRKRSTGLQAWCKECRSKYQKEKYAENKANGKTPRRIPV